MKSNVKSLELKNFSAQRLSFLVLFDIMDLVWHVRAIIVHNNTKLNGQGSPGIL